MPSSTASPPPPVLDMALVAEAVRNRVTHDLSEMIAHTFIQAGKSIRRLPTPKCNVLIDYRMESLSYRIGVKVRLEYDHYLSRELM